jgi:hypothetical protein
MKVDADEVTARRLSAVALCEWDEFAQACGASYHCSEAYIASKRLTHKIALFEFHAQGKKVGQCAIVQPRMGRKVRVFLDSLQLLCPEVHWLAAMRAVLKECGPGRYRYGSCFNLERPREEALRTVEHVQFVEIDRYQVQAVDLARWPDWVSYERALSNNIKRNAVKATKADPGIRIEHDRGVPSVRGIVRMLALNWRMFQRKHMPSFLCSSIRLVIKISSLRSCYDVSWVVHRGRYSAYALVLGFGDQFYYTNGASLKDNGGSAWYLMMEIIRKVKGQSPTGKFIMGFNPIVPDSNRVGWANVLRQREQCRVSNWKVSIVVFDVASPTARV